METLHLISNSMPLRGVSFQALTERATAARQAGAPEILLAELAPTLTFGRRGPFPEDLTLSEDALRARGVSVQAADRGGRTTYHGPGQWVVFPVVPISVFSPDARAARALAAALVGALWDTARKWSASDTALRSTEEGPELGLWIEDRKLGSVGFRIVDGWITHGVSLNVFATPLSFLGLRPCGLDAAPGFLRPAPDADFLAIGESFRNSVKARLTRPPAILASVSVGS